MIWRVILIWLLAVTPAMADLPLNARSFVGTNLDLTNDGTRSFTYDAENRLSSVSSGTNWRTDFVYGGLGRRRVAADSIWDLTPGGGGTWVETDETHYVLDGLVPIQERDINNNVLITYTRGPDLSWTLAGAGGIGGLLARTATNGSTYYHSDGEGNVTALIDGYQVIQARYSYDPFGRLVGQWGALAAANTMQFSSMPHHGNSGLSLYASRAYDPTVQRWLNQDPIGELGGHNLYRFVGNSPVNIVDPLGFGWFTDLFNSVGDSELAVADSVQNFFLGPPGGTQLQDPDIQRAGSGLIQGLQDENGNDITKQTVADIALQPLLGATALPGGAEEGALSAGEKAFKAGEDLAKAAEDAAKAGKAAEDAAKAAKCKPKWIWPKGKGVPKMLRQMEERGWTPQKISEAIENGEQFPAPNKVNPGNPATRYVDPTTGQSVVMDNVTGEILHVGGPGYGY